MNKKILLVFFISIISIESFSQQLPWGTCGIVNVYDAAGNRTKRVYFCNNGDPYPNSDPNVGGRGTGITAASNETTEFQHIDALAPNPTTGKFSITFSKALKNAALSITDNNGKTISSFRASGNKVEFDLSKYPTGIYFVRIEEDGKSITKKVVKQ